MIISRLGVKKKVEEKPPCVYVSMLHVSEDRKTYRGLEMHRVPVFVFLGVVVVLSLSNVEPEVMVDVVDALLTDIARKGK